jgi:hypothetical protein
MHVFGAFELEIQPGTPYNPASLGVAIADRERKIPADRPQDDLRRELPPLERVLVILLHRQPLSTPSCRSPGRASFEAATEPFNVRPERRSQLGSLLS